MPGPEASREREVFFGALELPRHEWPAFVERSCEGDSALRRRVEALLDAYVPTESRPTESFVARLADLMVDRQPSTIGPYRVLEKVGEGGMGVVYLAEQTHPVRRRVAVKAIKLGMDTKEVIARFESERQALALMNHHGIAQILDAGASDDGRPYFVMEYVPGIAITRCWPCRR